MLPLCRIRPYYTLRRCIRHCHLQPDPFGLPRHYSRLTSQDLSASSRSPSTLAHCAPYPARTHTCGSLTARDAGAKVVLTGWILPERKGKLMSFYPLKDSYGITQLIVHHSEGATDLSALAKVPVESTVLIEGTVLLRPPSARRPGHTAYRLCPRIPIMWRTMSYEPAIVAQIVRNVLHDHDFVEVETPVLLRSSPEGAREFLVPTRISTAGSDGASTEEPLFYALQQSPQQPKQLLMCSGGVDRYFQLAKCFRDEGGRKDRQPEFTQIDMEMAFVSWGPREISKAEHTNVWRIGGEEVRDVVETLIRNIWEKVEGVSLPKGFEVMTYNEAMTRFGSDKPDTRFGLEIQNITHLLPQKQGAIFEHDGEILECIPVHKASEREFIGASRACDHDSAVERVTITKKNLDSWLLNARTHESLLEISPDDNSRITDSLQLTPGDEIWLAVRPRSPKGGSTALGSIRLRLLEIAQSRGEFTVTKDPHFLWITEFPLFTQADADKDFLARGRWSSSHHPFTAPMWQDIEAMYRGNIESVRGQHYDLVLNGVEIGGGSVRVHDAAMQDYIFTHVLQLSETEKAPFQHLLHALQCGAPPHGGIALGFDRLMAMLCNTQSIRDVIAFPKASTGADLLFKSPAPIDNEVLHEYGIQSRSTT
ncbi:putative tRNA synthetases class II (D, K and N) [Lyophyllum shimeji]|uniref:tRNA synthetases class II (D, K and N) n=1 Tax=Lyophyllum shimeji TaxID=47721 RepID=A0A9P3PD29_LYOSH|nr:putative tRNA synthetases class II (D, K and N) [Lyophyllum shimeji]